MRTMRELTIQALSDRVVGANKTGDMMKKNRTKDLIAYSLISQYERYRVVEADAAVEALNRECESEVLKQSTSLVHTELIPNVTIDDVKDTRSMDADSVDLLGLCGNTEAGICSSSSHLKQPEIDVTSLLEWEESEVKGSTSCVAGDAVVKQPAIIIQPSDPPLVPVVPKPSKLQTNVQVRISMMWDCSAWCFDYFFPYLGDFIGIFAKISHETEINTIPGKQRHCEQCC